MSNTPPKIKIAVLVNGGVVEEVWASEPGVQTTIFDFDETHEQGRSAREKMQADLDDFIRTETPHITL